MTTIETQNFNYKILFNENAHEYFVNAPSSFSAGKALIEKIIGIGEVTIDDFQVSLKNDTCTMYFSDAILKNFPIKIERIEILNA